MLRALCVACALGHGGTTTSASDRVSKGERPAVQAFREGEGGREALAKKRAATATHVSYFGTFLFAAEGSFSHATHHYQAPLLVH